MTGNSETATLTRALLRRQLVDQLTHVRLLQNRGELHHARTAAEQLLHTAAGNAFDGATVWTARRVHAELLYDLGDTTQAHRLATALYHQLATALPARHPATIRTAVLLAGISHHQGDLDTAEHLCRWVLSQPDQRAHAEATPPPASRALLLAQAHLALITADQGDPHAGIDQLTEVLQHLQHDYGDRDLDTIRVRAHLADLHTTVGHPEQARRLLTRALHDACARYGPTHPTCTRLDRMLSAVEPPLPAADQTSPQEPPARPTHRPKHTRTPAGDSVPRTRTEPPGDHNTQATHHPASRPPQGRHLTHRHLARRAWSLAIIAALATAATGIQALRQPTPPANAQPAGPSADPNPVATNLTVRRGLRPGQIVTAWTDPSHGAATPVLTITDSTGQAVATITLPPGTDRYQRDHLDPHASYCVMLGLFASGTALQAVGRQACLPDP